MGTNKEVRGRRLAKRFNNAIKAEYIDDLDRIDIDEIIGACAAILVMYVSDKQEKKWKRNRLDQIWDYLMDNWGLR